MKNPFSKKNANVHGGASLFDSIRKKFGGIFKYKISLSIIKREPEDGTVEIPDSDTIVLQEQLPDVDNAREDTDAGASAGNESSEQPNPPVPEAYPAVTPAPAPEPAAPEPIMQNPINPERTVKPPREKKPKPPKPEKEKAQKKKDLPKQKKPEVGENVDNQKKFPILIVGIVGGVVAVGGGVFAALMILGSNAPNYAKIYENAVTLRAEQQYDKAQTEYNKILVTDDSVENTLVVNSYLGLSETYVEMKILDMAIVTLENGYERTSDPAIKERLDEITPKPGGEGEDDSEASSSPPEEMNTPIVWTDPALEKMVRIALEISDSRQIVPKDLEDIQSLKIVGATHAATDDSVNADNYLDRYEIEGVKYTERGEIRSLEDLKYFKNLKKLVVCYNSVSDISGVAELRSLHTLGLYANEITDINAISGIESLKYLYLFNNNINDISALKGLVNLTQLYVQHNSISDLSPLRGNESLMCLYLGNNEITDISDLSGLPNLRFLFADNNRITDIKAVADIKTLTDVSFFGNPTEDMSPASGIQNVNKTPGDARL